MALSKSALQQKKERKQKKRAQALKNKRLIYNQMEQLPLLNRGMIYDAWVSTDLKDNGIGHVVVSRTYNGMIIMVDFLLDTYCLGVKNVLIRKENCDDYHNLLHIMSTQFDHLTEVNPAYAKKLILSAVTYANSLGIHPHYKYNRAKIVFDDIDTTDVDINFEFGRDGKPCLIPGPDDSQVQILAWLDSLKSKCGDGKFNYLL